MFTLRPDQQTDYDLLTEYRKTNVNTIFTASTGYGKSVIQGKLAYDIISEGKTCLTLVHRDILVNQLADTYKKSGIKNLGYIKAGKPRNITAKCVIGSVQTLARRKLDFKPDYIILDECHIITFSKVVKKLFFELSEAMFIGFTATPMMINKKRQLSHYFEKEVIAPIPRKLIEMGNLAKDIYFVEKYSVTKEDINKLSIDRKTGEYNNADLIKLMDKPGFLESMVKHWVTHSENRLTIAFTPNVTFAYKLAECFNQKGYPAIAIDATLSIKERNKIYQQFSNREYIILINCMLLVEGFDVRHVETVMLCNPIRTMPNYIQKVGRGLRSFPGKVSCYILDLGWNLSRHGAISDLTKEDYMLHPPTDYEPVAAPTKTCPQCSTDVNISIMTCPNCGYKFPEKANKDINVVEELEKYDPTKVKISAEDMVKFYQSYRVTSFRKGYKPTYAFVNFINEFDGKKPKPSWSYRQLTTNSKGEDCNLERFFTWVADWAHQWYEGESIYIQFNHQVKLEFGVKDCKNLPDDIKQIARKCYLKASKRRVVTSLR